MAAMIVEAWHIEGDNCIDSWGKAADDADRAEHGYTECVLADHWEGEPLVAPAAGFGGEDSWPRPEGGGLLRPP